MSLSVTPLRYLRVPSVAGKKVVIYKTGGYKSSCERFVISRFADGWKISSPLEAKYGAQWRAWLNRVGLYKTPFKTRREALEGLLMTLDLDEMTDMVKP